MTAMQNGKKQATTKDKSLASTTKQRKSDNNKKAFSSQHSNYNEALCAGGHVLQKRNC